MVDERSISVSTYFSTDSKVVDRSSSVSSADASKFKSSKSYKYKNIGKDEVMGIMDDTQFDINSIDKKLNDQNKKSEIFLEEAGISEYISKIPLKKRKARTMYGFLGKPTRGAIKVPKKRWIFLISSRPLNQDDYLEDNEQIKEEDLPPLIEFDTIYYYSISANDNVNLAGEIKAIDIDNVYINSENDSKMHSFVIDCNAKKYEFVSKKRFVIEQWIDAIELSCKTAKEIQYSITGNIKNISMIITQYEIDRDQLKEEIDRDIDFKLWTDDMTNYKEFEEILETLALLTEIKDDMIYTFDACLVQKPPRNDIIEMYMESTHVKICERLTYEWTTKALVMNPIDILELLEWTYNYHMSLTKFGINYDSVKNGYLTLCNAYKRKIHLQIYPMVTNVLIRERDSEIEDQGNGELYTHSPNDIFKIFSEVFDFISKKPMKELVLGALEVIHEVFSQYQRALFQMINMESKLKVKYLIAINNNFSKFFDCIESLLDPVRKNESIPDEEINESFDQGKVQKLFGRITTKIISRIADATWVQIENSYNCDYLTLDMENVLNHSFKVFDDQIVSMNKQTAREAWKVFLRKTVISYIQIMLNSSPKIKNKSSDIAIAKLQEDYEKIYDMFSDVMSSRLLKSGLGVLNDLKNFFESSVEFLIFNIGKLREEHGPAFNMTTIKALLNLRTDLEKSQKQQVLLEAKEVIAKYKDDPNVVKDDIFSQVDTNVAAKEFNEDMKDPNQTNSALAQDGDSEEDEFDFDNFMKEGGINIDDLDDEIEDTEAARMNSQKHNKAKQAKSEKDVKKIVGREDMAGYLYKSSMNMKEKSLFEGVINTFTDTFQSVAGTVDKKHNKRF